MSRTISLKRGIDAAPDAAALATAAAEARAAAAEARAVAAERGLAEAGARLAIVEEFYIRTRPDLLALALPLIVYNGFGEDVVNCGYTCKNFTLGHFDELWKYLLNVERGGNKRTPLMYFASVGDTAKLSRALSLGAKKRTKALSWAVRFGMTETAEKLLAAGANLNAASFTERTSFGSTLAPLSIAVKYGHNSMIDFLCDTGGLVPTTDEIRAAKHWAVLSNLVARSGASPAQAKLACDAAARRIGGAGRMLGDASAPPSPHSVTGVLHAVLGIASKYPGDESVVTSFCEFYTLLISQRAMYPGSGTADLTASDILQHLANVQKVHPASERVAYSLMETWDYLAQSSLAGVSACSVATSLGLECAILSLQSFPYSPRVVEGALRVLDHTLSGKTTEVDAAVNAGAIPALVRVLRDGDANFGTFSDVLGVLARLPGSRVIAAGAHFHIATYFSRLPNALRAVEEFLPTWYDHIRTMITGDTSRHFASFSSELLLPIAKSGKKRIGMYRRTDDVDTHFAALQLVADLCDFGFAHECYAAMGGVNYFTPAPKECDLPLISDRELLPIACLVIHNFVIATTHGTLSLFSRRAELLGSEHVLSVLYHGMEQSWADILDPESGAAVPSPTHTACCAILYCLSNGAQSPRDRERCLRKLLGVLVKCKKRAFPLLGAVNASDPITRLWTETAAVVCEAVTLLVVRVSSPPSSSSSALASSSRLSAAVADACLVMTGTRMFSVADQRLRVASEKAYISLARNFPQAAVQLVAALRRSVSKWSAATTPATTDTVHGHLQMLLALAERSELKHALLSAGIVDTLSAPLSIQTATMELWDKAEMVTLVSTSTLWNKAMQLFDVASVAPPW